MKHVHFIGIGGAGLSALARVMLARGWRVSGSDRALSPRTRDLEDEGITIFEGHHATQVQGADVVVLSSAVPATNPERLAAEAAGIPVLKREQWLAEMTRDYEVVAVAGTHGKTTTTAMIALMLSEGGTDPTVVLGGDVPQLGGNARGGRSRLFVVEADEYDHAFLGLRPAIAVVLNVEHDHPDLFPDEAAVLEAFERFLGQARRDGIIVACMEDAGAREVVAASERTGTVVSYGFAGGLDWRAAGLKSNDVGGTDFVALWKGEPVGAFRVAVPGRHNVLNALAAIAVGQHLGLDVTTMQAALGSFTGVERRFQKVGSVGRIEIFDDYAHHPTAVRATLAAAREHYGPRPLWVVFQPHTFSRLAALHDEFAAAFGVADQVIVSDVYAARERGDAAEKSRILAAAISGTSVTYRATQEEILDYLLTHLPEDAVVLTLGAGDITALGGQLWQALRARLEEPVRQGGEAGR
jgi:UDP-N-acetylmuramate--alanine ligase